MDVLSRERGGVRGIVISEVEFEMFLKDGEVGG